MDRSKFKDNVGIVALVSLFFLECEYLLRMPEHHEVRRALRALIGFPLHDFVFAAIVFLFIAKFLAPDRVPDFKPRFSAAFLALHLGATALLDVSMLPFQAFLETRPVLLPVWWVVLGAYSLTWLATFADPRQWPQTFGKFLPWLAGGFAAGAFTVYFSKYVAEFWYALPKATLWMTEKWLALFFDHVSRGPEQFTIGVRGFAVDVGAPCSGYEGMGLIACYTAAFLWFRKDSLKMPQSLVLLPLSVLLSWTANTLRIAALIAIGACYSPRIALDGFHTQAGWLSFTLLGIALVVIVERAGWFRKDKPESEPLPSLPFLAPLMALFLTQIVSSAVTGDFDFFYPVRTTLLLLVLFHFRASYRKVLGPTGVEAVTCGLLVYFLWVLLAANEGGVDPSQYLQGTKLTGWILFRVLGSSVVIPIIEELAFRGYLLRRLQSPDFQEVPQSHLTFTSVLVSSFAFGLLHQDWVAGTLAGVAYALLLKRRGSLTDSIVAHGVTNLCLCVHVLASGAWGDW